MQRRERYYDPLETRQSYRVSLLRLLRQIYPSETRIEGLERIIYFRTQSYEYIQCATTLATLQRILESRILPDIKNQVNGHSPANGIISPAQAVGPIGIPIG
jgi:hypothetical protein